MDKHYLELFSLMARNTAALAEVVMDEHKEKNEQKEYENAQQMRDHYLDLWQKLDGQQELTRIDYSRLLIGSIITANQLQERIDKEESALQGWKLDVIPKLTKLNDIKDDEEMMSLAKEYFQVSDAN